MKRFGWLTTLVLLLALGAHCSRAAVATSKDLYREGTRLFEKKVYADALRYFKAASALNERDADVLYAVGLCQYKLGDNRQAVENMEKAVSINGRVKTWKSVLKRVRSEVEMEDLAPASADKITSGGRKGEPLAPGRLYISLYYPFDRFGGDLNGNVMMTSIRTGELVMIPSLKGGVGGGVGVGYRGFNGALRPLALEGSFQLTYWDATFTAFEGGARAYLVEATAKYHPIIRDHLRYYGAAGYTWGSIKADGGSYYQRIIQDAFFDIGGFHAGAGVEFHFNDRLFLDARALGGDNP
jgi:opacity protein-like surface antigen